MPSFFKKQASLSNMFQLESEIMCSCFLNNSVDIDFTSLAQCLASYFRDGDISWTMTSRGHYFSKWATSRGHSQRVTSRGHSQRVTFLGHFW